MSYNRSLREVVLEQCGVSGEVGRVCGEIGEVEREVVRLQRERAECQGLCRELMAQIKVRVFHMTVCE